MGDAEVEEDIRVIDIHRGSAGYGFNIKGTTQEGGILQAINGKLYAPLQYVSAVDDAGSAYQAGLRRFDRILEVNGEDVQGANHNRVVELVLRGGGRIVMRILRVSAAEAARLQRLEEAIEENKAGKSGPVALVAVPTYNNCANDAGQYTVFQIHLNGRYRCSRRYSQFAALHKQLKSRFRWFNFPQLPPKKMNGLRNVALSERELEMRRIQLDAYLCKVLAVQDILNSDACQQFLRPDPDADISDGDARPSGPVLAGTRRSTVSTAQPSKEVGRAKPADKALAAAAALAPDSDEEEKEPPRRATTASTTGRSSRSSEPPSTIKITVMDRASALELPFSDDTTVADLEEQVRQSLGLGEFGQHLFGLFVPLDKNGHVRKARESELITRLPHRLVLRKWLFTKAQEQFAEEDDVALDLLVEQASLDMKAGDLQLVSNAEEKLKALLADGEKAKFAKVARKMAGYGCVSFPNCKADFPDEGSDVLVKVSIKTLTLVSCEDGKPQTGDDAETEFPWDVVTQHKLSSNRKQVIVNYTTDDDDTETITIDCPQADYLALCLERIFQEREWARAVLAGEDATGGNFFRCRT
eukprot:m.24047 g.24047  ORF g.24047 m.24047 type:complete len:585 (-) comp11137_c0_seq1:46-1800(-)